MKKTLLLLTFFIAIFANAQEKEETYTQDINKKHEIKINTFSLIALSSFDVTYEYLLTQNTSFGIATFYNFDSLSDDINFPKKFSLTPFYRWFFSETRYARGFFVEGFGSLNTYQETFNFFRDNPSQIITETGFALGVSVGGKFVIKSGFTAEIYLGVGRNLINDESEDFYIENSVITRGGISLGYRF